MSTWTATATLGVAAVALLTLLLPVAAAASPRSGEEAPAADARVELSRIASALDWRAGSSDGVTAIPGPRAGIVMRTAAGTVRRHDPHSGDSASWEYATWVSSGHRLRAPATELITSWNAATPTGTWISLELRAGYTDGSSSPWYTVAHWAHDDADIKRASIPDQSDGVTTMRTDTLAVGDRGDGPRIADYQVRITLFRAPGTLASPRVWGVTTLASDVPDRFEVRQGSGGIAWGTELAVPRRSQLIHRGSYPHYGGGGEAWCSPASTTMVMEYFGFRPSRASMAWIEPAYTDPQVAHAARMTWDHSYDGAGNWPFNTAYAASFVGLDAFVTRLRSLEDLERLIAAGIPVITSQAFRDDELDDAGYGSAGHLFVVVGFTRTGDVIVNDPASPSNEAVRRIYPRAQVEQVWLRTKRHTPSGAVASGSGGVAYVIKPFWRPLPAGGDGSW